MLSTFMKLMVFSGLAIPDRLSAVSARYPGAPIFVDRDGNDSLNNNDVVMYTWTRKSLLVLVIISGLRTGISVYSFTDNLDI